MSALNYAVSVVGQKIKVEAPPETPNEFKKTLNSCFDFKPSSRPSADQIARQLSQY